MRLTRKDELKVGILAIILIVGVFAVILIFGNIDLGSKTGYEYILHFTFLDGLRAGASVRFSGGILCGNVLKVYPDNKYAAVRIWVEDTITISENSIFAISTAGLIGEKYIIIKQKKDGGERLANGTLIDRQNIVDPMNMDEALTKVNDIVIDINKISSSLSKYS
jgi:ABC-type transporter Mla subunit MlaD